MLTCTERKLKAPRALDENLDRGPKEVKWNGLNKPGGLARGNGGLNFTEDFARGKKEMVVSTLPRILPTKRRI